MFRGAYVSLNLSRAQRYFQVCHTTMKVLQSAGRTSNGTSNPEVVGSTPTKSNDYFFYLVCFLDSLY